MYVATALFLFDRVTRNPHVGWKTISAIVLLGVALSSRIPYILVLPPLFALIAQRNGLGTATRLIGAVLAVFVLVTLPVFLPHPLVRFAAQMSQNADKLQYLPSYLPAVSLPLFAAALACISFFVPMSLPRVYLSLGLTSLLLIGPSMATIVLASSGLGHPLPTDLEYFALPAIFISLWLFSRLEHLALERFVSVQVS